jgi:hypothetical protein
LVGRKWQVGKVFEGGTMRVVRDAARIDLATRRCRKHERAGTRNYIHTTVHMGGF